MRPLELALARLRAARRRNLLVGAGIFAVALMAGVAVTVGGSLRTGFERTAQRADLPTVIARFHPRDQREVARRLRSVANVGDLAFRFEVNRVALVANGHGSRNGAVDVVGPERRGYAVVAGRDLDARVPAALVDRGVAREWGVSPGQTIRVDGVTLPVRGVVVSPDNVAFPLASVPRVYVPRSLVDERFQRRPRTNLALVWLNDPGRLDETLSQGREALFGLRDLRLLTRPGIHVLLDRAAGIVVALLGAFAAVALLAALAMVAATSSHEVQRRLASVGTMRALGFSRGRIARDHGVEAALLALPCTTAGVALGGLLAAGPTARLLERLNQLAPGLLLVGWLAVVAGALTVAVALAAAWPAWRAAGRSPVQTLRGGDLGPGRLRLTGLRGGPLATGMQIAAGRPGRHLATAAVVACAAAVVLLLGSLAGLLDRLQGDPTVLGRRYAFTTDLPPDRAPALSRVEGVEAAPRYEADASDAFALGEPIRVIAYPGDHTAFEAPPLAAGRRLRTASEAEVGTGLADALGLHVGSTLAVLLGQGAEARFRVVGLVRVLDNDGRVAYTRPTRLMAADPTIPEKLAVRVAPGTSVAAVERRVRQAGGSTSAAAAATPSGSPGAATLLATLAAVVRLMAAVAAGVCLLVLGQAIALVARERAETLAVLRAGGAGSLQVALVLAGAGGLIALVAAPAAVALEALVLGPGLLRLAGGYVSASLAPGAWWALVIVGLPALAGALAAALAARMCSRPVAQGLRER